jgi:hypothetical protein
MYKTTPMVRAQIEQDPRGPSGSGAVPVLGDTHELALVGIVDRKVAAKSQPPKKASSKLTRNAWENGGSETTRVFPPFSYPAETVLLGTAIYMLNKEAPPGRTSRADRLGVRLPNFELEMLLWSGQKFRAENKVGEAELETAQKYILQSIRYLEAHIDERKALAGIPIPPEPEYSFKQRVLKIVGGLNVAQLDDLLKVVLEEPLQIRRRPTGNPNNLPFVVR